MQPVRKQSAARRATAGLAVANSREHNNADGCFLAGPMGAPQIGQCGVAVLVKGMPFPADCALPWLIWDALNPSILSCSTTSPVRVRPYFGLATSSSFNLLSLALITAVPAAKSNAQASVA